MKCFEKLILCHIKACLPLNLDPHQFAYRANRSTEGAIVTALHIALSHLEQPGSYVRMLFIDYSSAFNTIIPDILVDKLTNIALPPSTCAWIKDFMTDRPETVKVGTTCSSTLTIRTGWRSQWGCWALTGYSGYSSLASYCHHCLLHCWLQQSNILCKEILNTQILHL